MNTPAYGTKVRCDHDSLKTSLSTFVRATEFVGVVDIAGEVQYMGCCPVCRSTLAVEIDLVRGHVVSGQIESPFAGRVARHLEDIPDPDAPASEPIDWNDRRIR
jgi:hypothetical protein